MNCVINGQLISFAKFDNFDNFESLEVLEVLEVFGQDKSEILPDFQLILLHGWASNKELWTNLINDLLTLEKVKEKEKAIEALDKNSTQKMENMENMENKVQPKSKTQTKFKKLQIFSLDLPGFGESQKPKSDWFVYDYAELVALFIQKNCQKKIPIIIVGHSFGGRIGIKLASENFEKNLESRQNKLSKNQNLTNFCNELSQKDYQITKLILIGSAGFVNNSADLQLKKGIAKILKPIFSLRVMQNLKKQIYQKVLKNDDYLNTSMKQTFVNTIDEDLTDFMKEIKIPTLLIFGDKDTETPPTFGHRMNKLIPNSSLKIISGDHFAFVDKSKEIAVLIADFLV